MRKVVTLLASIVVFGIVACGKGDIGEDCNHEGRASGECVDGAVCGRKTTPTEGNLVCLKQCTSPASCGANEECGAVGFTDLRGCRATTP
jgi:hypothetical protein